MERGRVGGYYRERDGRRETWREGGWGYYREGWEKGKMEGRRLGVL